MIQGKDYIGVGCGAIIINDNNEILLLKRSQKNRNDAGFWTCPGGAVEWFENTEEAVIREAKEEVGLDVEVVRLLKFSNMINQETQSHWVGVQYLCRVVSGEPVNVESDVHEEVKWFSLDDLPEKLTIPVIDGLESLL